MIFYQFRPYGLLQEKEKERKGEEDERDVRMGRKSHVDENRLFRIIDKHWWLRRARCRIGFWAKRYLIRRGHWGFHTKLERGISLFASRQLRRVFHYTFNSDVWWRTSGGLIDRGTWYPQNWRRARGIELFTLAYLLHVVQTQKRFTISDVSFSISIADDQKNLNHAIHSC